MYENWQSLYYSSLRFALIWGFRILNSSIFRENSICRTITKIKLTSQMYLVYSLGVCQGKIQKGNHYTKKTTAKNKICYIYHFTLKYIYITNLHRISMLSIKYNFKLYCMRISVKVFSLMGCDSIEVSQKDIRITLLSDCTSSANE